MSDVKKCCQNEKNLGEPKQEREDLTVRVCAKCQCRHFELTVDPLNLLIREA